MQIILNWLSGNQNFTVGATLYKTFGDDQAFKAALEEGETPELQQQLISELQKLATPPEVDTPRRDFLKYLGFYSGLKPDSHSPATSNLHPETSEMPPGTDEVLIAVRNEWQPIYQRMNLLRHNLDKYGPDNSPEAIAYRKPLAVEIKQLEKQCNAIWAKRDHYLKEGKLPFVADTTMDIPTDPVQLANLINNIKKSIRTNRKLMKDHPDNPVYAQRYNQYREKHRQVTGKDYDEK